MTEESKKRRNELKRASGWWKKPEAKAARKIQSSRPEARERILASKMRYYEKHKEKINAKLKEKRDKDPSYNRKKASAWYHANKSKKRDYDRKYRKIPSVAEKNRAKNLENYYKNPQKFRDWEKKNPEKTKASKKKWAKNNPEYARQKCVKRRALKLKATIGDESDIVAYMKQVKEDPNTSCQYCRTPLFGKAIHFDHVIPLTRGGPHCVANLFPSCPSCNHSKHAKLLEEWIRN